MSKDKIKLLVISNIFTAIIAIAALMLAVFLYTQRTAIAYIDNTRVLTEYNGVKEGKKMYDDRVGQWQMNVDTLEVEIDADITSYKENFSKMTGKEKKITEELIKRKQNNYFSYKKAMEEKATEEDQKISEAVLNQINGYLLEHGKKNDYDLILGVTDMGNLLYAKEGLDITDKIIKELNSQYKGE